MQRLSKLKLFIGNVLIGLMWHLAETFQYHGESVVTEDILQLNQRENIQVPDNYTYTMVLM
jgi:hypothetical protein